MVEFKDRLTEAMREAGISTSQLAKALKVSYQAVKKAVDGRSHSLSAANNDAAAAILNVESRWLATGKGPKRRAIETSDTVVRENVAPYAAERDSDPWIDEAIATLTTLDSADRRAAVLNLRVFVASLTPPAVGQALSVAGKKRSH